MADSYGIPFIETSAKSSENVNKLFEDSAKAFLENQSKMGNPGLIKNYGPSEAKINLSAKKIKTNKKRKCC